MATHILKILHNLDDTVIQTDDDIPDHPKNTKHCITIQTFEERKTHVHTRPYREKNNPQHHSHYRMK